MKKKFGGKPFSSLQVNPLIIKSIEEDFKFTKMTPVQENTIPLLISQYDTVVEAFTGSGKTLSYLIPVFQHVMEFFANEGSKDSVVAVVVCPTRELARQVYSVAQVFLKKLDSVKLNLVVGGDERIEKYEGNIVIGTPGRIFEMCNNEKKYQFFLDEVRILILDEADRILDLGFENQINYILTKVNRNRRTGLFSATQTKSLSNLIRMGMKKPINISISVENQSTPKELDNYYVVTKRKEKFDSCVNLLKEIFITEKNTKTILFLLTCSHVDFFEKILGSIFGSEIKLFSIHGKMKAIRREKTYESFRSYEGECLCICTDIFARGMDIPKVTAIVQYDPPNDPTQYIHRVGRTGRMGKDGSSFVILTEEERDFIIFLSTKSVPVKEKTVVNNQSYHQNMIDMIKSDRTILEYSVDALQAYLQAYKKHQLKSIFKMNTLKANDLLWEFGILRISQIKKIKELRKADLKDFEEIDINLSEIKFKDTRKEKARKIKMEEKKKEKEKKREKFEERTRMKGLKKKKQIIKKQKPGHSKKRKKEYEFLEFKEMRQEEYYLKQLKTGKINREEYDRLTGEDEMEKYFKKNCNWIPREDKKKKRKRSKSLKRKKKKQKTK